MQVADSNVANNMKAPDGDLPIECYEIDAKLPTVCEIC
jgi:hypothetical protein